MANLGRAVAEDGEVSEKLAPRAAFRVLGVSGGAERALLGPGLEETGVESSNTRCAGAH